MRAIKYRELKHLCESMGPAKAEEHLTEALREGHLQARDFSIREWALASMGHEFVELCNPTNGPNHNITNVMESAGDGVDVTAFRNITGQIVFSQIMQAFEAASKVATALVPAVPTKLDGEKIPGVTRTNDAVKIRPVQPGMPYERVGVVEDYIDTPPTQKYGEIVPVTKEAIFFDRTALVLTRAAEVGEWLGVTKEKLLMDTVSGFGGGSTPTFALGGKWKWRSTEYPVYTASATDFTSDPLVPYTNEITDVLADYTDLDAALEKYGEMQDPNTQEPIVVAPMLTLLVGPALFPTARNIVNATELRVTTGSSVQTLFTNPFGSSINVVESRYLHRRLIDNAEKSAANARLYWFLGDFSKAFAWMENWPITPSQAPPNAEAEFDRDIVTQYKASMRGVPAVLKPHFVLRSTGQG